MSDTVSGAIFEIGQDPGGIAAMQAWLTDQINNESNNNLIVAVNYDEAGKSYIALAMSDFITNGQSFTDGVVVTAKTFNIRNGMKDMTDWMQNVGNGLIEDPGTAPLLSVQLGGSLTGQGTLYVQTVPINAVGYGQYSAEASIAVPDNYYLVVASPIDASGLATGWQVYIGATSGSETQQGGNFELGIPVVLETMIDTGTAAPANADTAVAWYLQDAVLNYQEGEPLVTVIQYGVTIFG